MRLIDSSIFDSFYNDQLLISINIDISQSAFFIITWIFSFFDIYIIFLLFHCRELILDFWYHVLDFCLFHKRLQFLISHSCFFEPLFSLVNLIFQIFYLIKSFNRGFKSLLKYSFHPSLSKVQLFHIKVHLFTVYSVYFVYHFRYV